MGVMTFKTYKDIKTFYTAVYDILLCGEVQNLVPLGNIIIGNEGKDKTEWRDSANWFMATVSDANGIKLTALMTPPFNLTLYMTDNIENEDALDSLVDGLLSENITIPGILAENSLAILFAEKYAKVFGKPYHTNMKMRIHQLQKVNLQPNPTNKIRLLTENDMDFFPFWVECMNYDFFEKPIKINDDIKKYLHLINQKNCYILEDNGIPVTIAKASRPMQTVCGVADVYTPPYFRRRGYATSCVAQLSQLLLDKGYEKCALYTDLSNPISNSIYKKVGYTPVCDTLDIKFEEEQK
ncbi:MAG: GNAT family N-acetyltransferase [Defluviitaleaceae bacterium]|nr:GNAT family N-acetyltransferase [Defluviitaleaceae bacterium]